jgi:hypothetical protein
MRAFIFTLLLAATAQAQAPSSSTAAPSTTSGVRKPLAKTAPSLAQVVALSAEERPVTATAAPAATATVPAFPAPASSTAVPAALLDGATHGPQMPWAALSVLVLLACTAGGVWWQKQKQKTASGGPLLTVREATPIGPRRSLLVVDVAGRRVLLSSSEAGIGMLLDCGPAPVGGGDAGDPDRFFGDALVRAVRGEPTVELASSNEVHTGPAGPIGVVASSSSSSSSSTAVAATRKNEVEATEIIKRLQAGRPS